MKLYRYADSWSGGSVIIHLEVYETIRETPKGWWIKPHWWGEWGARIGKNGEMVGVEKWVRKLERNGRKRFAYETPEKALESYKARKAMQVKHLRYQLKMAELCAEAAEKIEPQTEKRAYRYEEGAKTPLLSWSEESYR